MEAAGRCRGADRPRSLLVSRDLEELSFHLGRWYAAGPFGVRRAPGFEQGDLVESTGAAFEQGQPAGGNLRVVAIPGTAIRILVSRSEECDGRRLDPPRQPIPSAFQVHSPRSQPEVGLATDAVQPDPPAIPADSRERDIGRLHRPT